MMAKKRSFELVKVDPGEVLERYRTLVPPDTFACILSELDRPLPQADTDQPDQRGSTRGCQPMAGKVWLGVETCAVLRHRLAGAFRDHASQSNG